MSSVSQKTDRGHLLVSRGSYLKFLVPRTSVMLPLHGLPFLFRGVVMKPWLISCGHCCNDSLPTTWRAVSASRCVLSQWLVCCIHQEFTRKMGTVHWPQWELYGVCWSMIIRLSSSLSRIPGESQSFLNDPHTLLKGHGIENTLIQLPPNFTGRPFLTIKKWEGLWRTYATFL
jgi:hypothetical protein